MTLTTLLFFLYVSPVASFMPDSKRTDSELILVNNDKHYFRAKTSTIVQPGWKGMYRYLSHRNDEDHEEENDENQSSEEAIDESILTEHNFEEEEQETDIDTQLFTSYCSLFPSPLRLTIAISFCFFLTKETT